MPNVTVEKDKYEKTKKKKQFEKIASQYSGLALKGFECGIVYISKVSVEITDAVDEVGNSNFIRGWFSCLLEA